MAAPIHKCSACREHKPPTAYSTDKRARNGLQAMCKECCNLRTRERRLANPELFRQKARAMYKKNPNKYINLTLVQNYGITLEQKTHMIAVQDNKCFLCSITFSEVRGPKAACVDHSHETGQVRKILCGSCNSALGYISENFETALNMARYIQEYSGIV